MNKTHKSQFVLPTFLQKLKLKYYNLMIQLDQHEGSYLSICKHYRAIYDTPCIQAESEKWQQVRVYLCNWHGLFRRVICIFLFSNLFNCNHYMQLYGVAFYSVLFNILLIQSNCGHSLCLTFGEIWASCLKYVQWVIS